MCNRIIRRLAAIFIANVSAVLLVLERRPTCCAIEALAGLLAAGGIIEGRIRLVDIVVSGRTLKDFACLLATMFLIERRAFQIRLLVRPTIWASKDPAHLDTVEI